MNRPSLIDLEVAMQTVGEPLLGFEIHFTKVGFQTQCSPPECVMIKEPMNPGSHPGTDSILKEIGKWGYDNPYETRHFKTTGMVMLEEDHVEFTLPGSDSEPSHRWLRGTVSRNKYHYKDYENVNQLANALVQAFMRHTKIRDL